MIDLFLNPARYGHQIIILICICILGFGNYFCYDSPSAIEVQIENAMSINTGQFTSLYAWYSWPNIIMCFFGGLLIDKVLGIRIGAIVFLVLLLIGQVILALGAFSNQFWMMQLGRFVYGLGGESLSVAQNTYVVSWFQGSLLNAVFGLQITVSRAGSTLALVTMEPIYNATRAHNEPRDALGYTFLIAATTCAISLVVAVILALLDKRAERILQRPVIAMDEAKFSFKDAIDFKMEFWMLSIICVTFYATIFPFISMGTKFFEKKFTRSASEAAELTSIVYLIAAGISPFIGLFVDKVGRNLYFLLSATIMVTVSHIMMTLMPADWNLWIPMIIFGIGYSVMCSALWPLVALIIPQRDLGTAYGIMQAIQNLGLGVTNEISGMLVDWKGYIYLESFFVFWASVSVIATMILLVQDVKSNGQLNTSATQRRLLQETDQSREPLMAEPNPEDHRD